MLNGIFKAFGSHGEEMCSLDDPEIAGSNLKRVKPRVLILFNCYMNSKV